MDLFVSADYHLGHANIIRYCDRPFKSLDHMNKYIIDRHNERIKPDDQFIHNGDFCFRNSPGGKAGEGSQTRSVKYIDQLNGRKFFISGNHDKNNTLKSYIHSLMIRYSGMEIYVVHTPSDAVSFGHPINFVGHVHNAWKFKKQWTPNGYIDLINVGIDVWGYMPRKIDEILKAYNKWKKLNK